MKTVGLTLSAEKINPARPDRLGYSRCWRFLTMNRRNLVVLFSLMVVIYVGPKLASAQQAVARSSLVPLVAPFTDIDPSAMRRVEQLARQEAARGGKLLGYYFSPDERNKAFMEDFPGLVEEAQGPLGPAMTTRMIQEASAGQRTADWNLGSLRATASMAQRGLVAEIDWAAYGVPQSVVEPRLNACACGASDWVIVFNTQAVSAEQIPTDLYELRDAKWKGRIVADPGLFPAVMAAWSMLKGYDMARAKQLAGELLKSGNLLISSSALSLVLSGERPVMLGQAASVPALLGWIKGAPVDLKYFKGSGTFPQFFQVMKNTRVPNMTLLRILWEVSDRGHQMIKKLKVGWYTGIGPLANPDDRLVQLRKKAFDQGLLWRETLENWEERNQRIGEFGAFLQSR